MRSMNSLDCRLREIGRASRLVPPPPTSRYCFRPTASVGTATSSNAPQHASLAAAPLLQPMRKMSDRTIGACWLQPRLLAMNSRCRRVRRDAAAVLAKSPKVCARRPHGPRHSTSQHRRRLAKATSSRLHSSSNLLTHVDGKRQPYDDTMHESCSSGRHREISSPFATLDPNYFQPISSSLAFEAYSTTRNRLLRLGKRAATRSSVGIPASV